jgi:hypothetical protein
MQQLNDRNFTLFEDALLVPLRGHTLTDLETFVACLLLSATSEKPKSIKDIIDAVQLQTGKRLDLRAVMEIVRSLRKEHAFPILSRKAKPNGYWWCSSIEDMQVFIEAFRSVALDELHTLSRIIKENYPELAGQLKLDF